MFLCATRFFFHRRKKSSKELNASSARWMHASMCTYAQVCTHTCARLRAQTCRGGIDPLCRSGQFSTPAPSFTLLVRPFVSFLGAAIKTPTTTLFVEPPPPTFLHCFLSSRCDHRSNFTSLPPLPPLYYTILCF